MKLKEVLDMLADGWNICNMGLGHFYLRKDGEQSVEITPRIFEALKRRGLVS